MTSMAQIEANRRNALESTGPKTAEGKAASRANALKHGLAAKQVIVLGEKAEDFEAFHAELWASLDPADGLEEQLVERIVLCAWRLRRACRAEAGVVAEGARRFEWSTNGRKANDGVLVNDIGVIGALSRYETSIERALHRTLALLEQRQARRRREDPGTAPREG